MFAFFLVVYVVRGVTCLLNYCNFFSLFLEGNMFVEHINVKLCKAVPGEHR